MTRCVYALVVTVMLVLPTELYGVSTTHYDKPSRPNMALPHGGKKSETLMEINSTLAASERQRRLIPYMTFYLTHNFNRPAQQQYRILPQKLNIAPEQGKYVIANYQPKYAEPPPPVLYQPKLPYTPFLENNKLPGQFTPMINPLPIRVQVSPKPEFEKQQEPDYSVIFDKLLELKQGQYNKQQFNERPQYYSPKPNIAAQYFTRNYATRPASPPIKIIVEKYPDPIVEHRYTPIPDQYKHLQQYKIVEEKYKVDPEQYKANSQHYIIPEKYKTAQEPLKPTQKPFTDVDEPFRPIQVPIKPTLPPKTIIHTYTPTNIEINEHNIQNYDNFESLKTYNQIPAPVSNYQSTHIKTAQPENDYQRTEEPEKNYEPIIIRPVYRPDYSTKNNQHYYQRPILAQYTKEPEIATVPQVVYEQTENPNSLSVILKQLQDSNTLPQTLTPDNIDNSIKTLVHILNALKQTQKFQQPIVVAEETETEHQEEITDPNKEITSHTVTQTFPANTPEGGTPGKPGIDYPAYSSIPQTNFNCKAQRYKGFFGDPETNCQVWHYCDLNGGQASFLCPNGTIFSQVALTCDWWYNVKCATTTQLYVLNERLYKYILPFNPKFPEDYSGPLVDRYLALKFKEMEEKMRKQKKGKTEKPADDTHNTDVDKLQVIEAESENQHYTTVNTTDGNE